MPHLRTHATLYSVHKLVLPDRKNDFGSKKEKMEKNLKLFARIICRMLSIPVAVSLVLKMEEKSRS